MDGKILALRLALYVVMTVVVFLILGWPDNNVKKKF